MKLHPVAGLRDILPHTEEKHHACISPSETPDLLKGVEAYKGEYQPDVIERKKMMQDYADILEIHIPGEFAIDRPELDEKQIDKICESLGIETINQEQKSLLNSCF